MTVSSVPSDGSRTAHSPEGSPTAPRLGGLFLRMARATTRLTLPLAGKRWNPVFAVVEHRGRRTGRSYEAPVAARRIPGGFVISLAFGAHVDWYRNLLAAGGGTIRWRGDAYPVTAPEPIDPVLARPTFLAVQRALLRVTGIDGFVRVGDQAAAEG